MYMDNNIINIAPRNAEKRSKKNDIANHVISVAILGGEITWFVIRRVNSIPVKWWELFLLLASLIISILALHGLRFISSSNRFNEKVADKPLIAFDPLQNVFIVESYEDKKSLRFYRNDVNSVRIDPTTDEATLKYMKDGKVKDLPIGYADYHLEKRINDSIYDCKIDEDI